MYQTALLHFYLALLLVTFETVQLKKQRTFCLVFYVSFRIDMNLGTLLLGIALRNVYGPG